MEQQARTDGSGQAIPARGRSRYMPPWPSLDPRLLARRDVALERPFPFNDPHAIYASRARNLIYDLFRALVPAGGRVLVPDYHHGVEIAAIRAAGATPVPYAIGADLQPDLGRLEVQLRTARPVALFVVHYFGWPQPMEKIAAMAKAHDIYLVEDCALSLFSALGTRPLGTFGDFAVFCLYKTLPVPDGAVLVQNAARLSGLDGDCRRAYGWPTLAGRLLDLTLYRVGLRASGCLRVATAAKRLVGRALDAGGVRRMPIGDAEFDLGTVDTAMSRVSKALLPKFDREAIRRRRRRNFTLLEDLLSEDDRDRARPLDHGICPLFFPVVAPDKRTARRRLLERGIETIELWNQGDRELDAHATPVVRALRASVLELPIHQDLDESDIVNIAEQVRALGLQPLPLRNGREP